MPNIYALRMPVTTKESTPVTLTRNMIASMSEAEQRARLEEILAARKGVVSRHFPKWLNDLILLTPEEIECMTQKLSVSPGAEQGKQDDEFAWLIERGDSSPSAPTYWTGPDCWSQDHMDAVRFARKQDAERVACRLGQGYHRVCEHGWMS